MTTPDPYGTSVDPPLPRGAGPFTSPPTAAVATTAPEVPARPGMGHLPPLDTSYDKDRHRRRAPLGWLPVALVLALLGLLGLMLLAGATAGDDGDGSAATETLTQSGAQPGADADRGRLNVGSTDVLQDAGTLGRIGTLSGQRVSGKAVLVQQVVSDEGFWVGASSSERVYVYLTPEARGTGESPFQVKTGQRVDLTGTLAGLKAGDAERFGVTDAEGATQLDTQRAYVSAASVRLSA